jgi:hypothetical protein
MKTDFDFSNKYLMGPVVFRPDFNAAAKAIDVTQAWSLFFTAGQEDKALGFNAEAGQFFTYALLAVGTAGVLWSLVFSTVG